MALGVLIMGRKRSGNEWLPMRVYAGKSAYEYRPKAGGCIRLAPLSAKAETVIRRHDEEKLKLELLTGSFHQLCKEFLCSSEFYKLATGTQKDYQRCSLIPIEVFGKVDSKSIKPEHIRKFMDKRGKRSETRANREHSFMSKVFSWSYERGKVTLNPCLKVRKFTETPRKRYIKDDEYNAMYTCARDQLKAAMEISYCCASRQGDILSLSRNDILEEGLYVKQGKTQKIQIKKWTPRLKAAIKLAIDAQPVSHVERIFVSKGGHKVTTDMIGHWWKRAKAEAKSKYPSITFDFTFHDIKAKSISDYEGNKQTFSGHKTASQVAVYDRKPEIVDSHN